ncbi:MAG: hypothetical protein COV29_04335 [Candidatus Yanofskybacteria bacterium CG10_big_fil_rev_8_21_14_0_10_36_16]|uniref:Glycoside hydrolase family 5 domain-containing protein n=1 Tax=Candidatus Yanofskybacteria bacterium CG10_big_fil_rev_8_21_14_0_10_36_16 TaxID=1975096 RepID=A0A2J0Q6E8_9BACT|nr:MAG: hypothetical protein COV29_04335 [Candidatus Yanofskybacteria bacterium CG10_big_fil_rev_8_21_14_0_10_36_16]
MLKSKNLYLVSCFLFIWVSSVLGQNGTCSLPEIKDSNSLRILLPRDWKGINYYPENHHFYHMLNDWWTVDEKTNLPVHQVVDNDMALMRKNGFNFLHLYIWDNVWFRELNDWPGIGFNPIGQNPCLSNNDQFLALDDFITKARRHNLYVGISFVTKPVIDKLNSGITAEEAAKLGKNYYDWTSVFINSLAPRHRNILLWGFIYGFGPSPDAGVENPWNVFYKNAYEPFYQLAKDTALYPGLGLVGVNLTMPSRQTEDGSFVWDTKHAQKQAGIITEMNLPDPDIYMLQLYNANSLDLTKALKELSESKLDEKSKTIPYEKIFAIEFGSSSSFADPPYGNNMEGFGDALSPSFDAEGHAQSISNTLCALESVGINKLGYWTLYDAWNFWQKPPFNFDINTFNLAWNGYWGLLPHTPSTQNQSPPKPAFKTLSSFYKTKSLHCEVPPEPIVKLQLHKQTVLLDDIQKVTLAWTAAEARNLVLKNGNKEIPLHGTAGRIELEISLKSGEERIITLVANNFNNNETIVSKTSVTIKYKQTETPMRSRSNQR